MFQSLILSAKAQPVRRAWTSSQPIEESVTILSPPSPLDEEHKDDAVVRTPVQVPVVAPPPPPPQLSLLAPLPPSPSPLLPPVQPPSEVDALRGKLDLIERRLDALDKSDARTKAGMAQLLARLEDNVAVIRTSLDTIERNASQPGAAFLQAVEQSEIRCKQYYDDKWAEDGRHQSQFGCSAPETRSEPTEPEVSADTENENELTVEERHVRQRPSCRNSVLCGILSVVSLPLQLFGLVYAYRSFFGAEAAFYPDFGVTQVYP